MTIFSLPLAQAKRSLRVNSRYSQLMCHLRYSDLNSESDSSSSGELRDTCDVYTGKFSSNSELRSEHLVFHSYASLK